MIQRKQTLFLVISGVLMALMPFLELVQVVSPTMLYSMNGVGFEDATGELVQPTWVLFGFGVLITLLSFIAVFMYTRRVQQARVTMFNLILKLGYLGLVFVVTHRFIQEVAVGGSYSVTPWLALPIVAAIFDYLAHRNILIDERIVRTMDRLR